MHAMTPGHGKAVVGAYLVGSRGTVKHALYLGLTTTITHTLGVFAFGLITLLAAQYVVPEKLFPWITFFSGLFVVGIGLNLFFQRFRSSGLGARFGRWNANRQSLQPAFSASMQRLHIEPNAHVHEHSHVLTSAHGHTHDHDQPHAHGHDHDHHHHGGAEHSHTPPEAITWRSILALGVSGGLLPCPSALVVLLGAIALNRIGFGLILVFAFSLGLASALTAIGMMFIYAGKLFRRFPSSSKVIGILPVVSALFISLIGFGILYRALMEILI
jgi:ABC-type nickel/cobalt efflux system permease component RcnA